MLSRISTAFRKNGVICTTAFLLSAATLSNSALALDGPEVRVRFAGYLPVKHYISQSMETFRKTVEEKSGGKITVETYPAGQLYNNTELHQAVVGGQVEMGVGVISEFADVLPAMGIVDLPFLMSSSKQMQAALTGELGSAMSALSERIGLKMIGWTDNGFTNAVGNTKHPVKVPGDFSGLKVRSFGIFPGITLQTLGASPVNLSSAETYQAVQRGVIDGGLSLATSFYSRKWYEVLDYVTIVPLGYVTYGIYANNDWWNELPADYQKILSDAAREMSDYSFEYTATANTEAIEKMQAAGTEVYVVPADEYPQWTKILEPVYDEYLKRTGDDGKHLLDIAKKYQSIQ